MVEAQRIEGWIRRWHVCDQRARAGIGCRLESTRVILTGHADIGRMRPIADCQRATRSSGVRGVLDGNTGPELHAPEVKLIVLVESADRASEVQYVIELEGAGCFSRKGSVGGRG